MIIDPGHDLDLSAAREIDPAAARRVGIPQGDADTMTPSYGLHPRENAFENLFELRRTQQQLVDLAQRFQRLELLLEARGGAIERRNELARLVGVGNRLAFVYCAPRQAPHLEILAQRQQNGLAFEDGGDDAQSAYEEFPLSPRPAISTLIRSGVNSGMLRR